MREGGPREEARIRIKLTIWPAIKTCGHPEIESEVRAKLTETREYEQFRRAAFDLALFQFPRSGMRNEDGVQA